MLTLQRALMRVRQKLIEEANERDQVHQQRMRLFEMAHLNEKERQARLEQYKLVRNHFWLDDYQVFKFTGWFFDDQAQQWPMYIKVSDYVISITWRSFSVCETLDMVFPPLVYLPPLAEKNVNLDEPLIVTWKIVLSAKVNTAMTDLC